MNDLTITDVRETERTQTGVTYSALVNGQLVTRGGCAQWTQEQFVRSLQTSHNLAEAWQAVLSEDNFITRSLGLYR